MLFTEHARAWDTQRPPSHALSSRAPGVTKQEETEEPPRSRRSPHKGLISLSCTALGRGGRCAAHKEALLHCGCVARLVPGSLCCCCCRKRSPQRPFRCTPSLVLTRSGPGPARAPLLLLPLLSACEEPPLPPPARKAGTKSGGKQARLVPQSGPPGGTRLPPPPQALSLPDTHGRGSRSVRLYRCLRHSPIGVLCRLGPFFSWPVRGGVTLAKVVPSFGKVK